MSKHSKTKDTDIATEREIPITKESDQDNGSGKETSHATQEGEVRPVEAVSAKDEEIASLRRKVEELTAAESAKTEEVASLKDQYLRKAADYENFRKRMFREKDEAVLFANQNLLVDLVSVIDDLDRAIEAAARTKDFSALFQGIEMTRKKFLSMLESKYALRQFDSKGKPFDHHIHEAVMMEHRDGISEPTVVEEFMKGYQLNERVIRTTKVKVAMPQAEAAPKENTADKTADNEGMPDKAD